MKSLIKNEKARLDILEYLQQFPLFEQIIYGHKNGPRFGTSKIYFDKLRAVMQQHSDSLAFFESHLQETVSNAIDSSIQFAIADSFIAKN